jgi:hypothetical protein
MTKAVTAILVVLSAAPAFAQDEHVGARVREWYAKMEGNLTSNGDLLGGTSINLASDLGLDSPGWSAEVQVYGHIPFFGKLYAGWWRVERSGDEILSRTITFANQSFTAATEVKTDVTLDVGYLTYEFDFPSIPLGDFLKWELGLQVGARIMRGEGSLDSAFASGSDSGLIGIPVLGGHAALQVTPYLRADVELVGLGFSYSSHKGSYLEAYGEVVAQPFSWLFAGVGYKYVSLRVKDTIGSTDFDLDIHITGLYLTAGVRF